MDSLAHSDSIEGVGGDCNDVQANDDEESVVFCIPDVLDISVCYAWDSRVFQDRLDEGGSTV